MSRQFVLPDLGEGVKEGQVLRLLVAEGDHIDEDQILMEVETDKSAVEIPSPYTGTVTHWHVEEQQVVNVGDVMVTFDGEDAAAPKRTAKTAAAGAATSAAGSATNAPAGNGRSDARRRPASPAVRKMARRLGIDLTTIHGSGPGGRILRGDLEQAAPTSAPTPTPAPSPIVSRSVEPPPAPGPVRPAAALPPGEDGSDAYGPIRTEPIGQTRRAIAGVMSRAVATIPHVTDSDDADVTELDRMRREYNDGLEREQKLGLLPFVVRAVALALTQHPALNASWDDERNVIVYKRYYHIAVGVQTERGLVAPVLRDADRKGVRRIADELNALAHRARNGSLSLDESRGATYTISNAGAMGGSRYSTPIITPPQVAVLAIGRSRMQPWVVDGQIVPRLIMPFSHSMDHRLIDGAVEIAFMQQVITDLQRPAKLLIDPPSA